MSAKQGGALTPPLFFWCLDRSTNPPTITHNRQRTSTQACVWTKHRAQALLLSTTSPCLLRRHRCISAATGLPPLAHPHALAAKNAAALFVPVLTLLWAACVMWLLLRACFGALTAAGPPLNMKIISVRIPQCVCGCVCVCMYVHVYLCLCLGITKAIPVFVHLLLLLLLVPPPCSSSSLFVLVVRPRCTSSLYVLVVPPPCSSPLFLLVVPPSAAPRTP